jgi:hypothetical protein
MFWRKWVGLPWEWGADPRDGKAACCFRTAQAAREELGMPWPSDRMGDWYKRARSGEWTGLRWDWGDATDSLDLPEAGALIRFDNLDLSFGLGVLATPEILITVRHRGRLVVAPFSAFQSLPLYRLK